MNPQQWYWLAINGSSCAAWEVPCDRVRVTPTPEILIGVSTRIEQLRLQAVCLNSPIEDVRRELQQVAALASVRQSVFRRPSNPGPQTSGLTAWEIV